MNKLLTVHLARYLAVNSPAHAQVVPDSFTKRWRGGPSTVPGDFSCCGLRRIGLWIQGWQGQMRSSCWLKTFRKVYSPAHKPETPNPKPPNSQSPNIAALIIRIGFGVYYARIINKEPPKTLFYLLRPLHYSPF